MEREPHLLTTLDQRIEQFGKLLTENPDDVSALEAYGEANMLRGRLLEAMKSYQRLATLQGESVPSLLALGKIYLDSGLLNEASDVLGRALGQDPDNIEGHILLARLQKTNGRVPAELEQPMAHHREFLPSPGELTAQRDKINAELAQIDTEIAEHERAIKSGPVEPALEFGLQMARQRRARLQEAVAAVEVWEARHADLEAERRRVQEEEDRRRLVQEEEDRKRQEAEEIERRRLAEEEAERRRVEQEEEDRKRREAEEQAERERQEREAVEAAEREAASGQRVREQAYAQLGVELEPVTTALMKTKGVTSVLVLARDGFVVHRSQSQDFEATKVSAFIINAVEALSPGGVGTGDWQFWVLEFSKGILVLQRVTPDYYLLVVGQAGANFGVLTWTIDKNKAQLEAVLAGAPPVTPDGA